MLIKSNVLETSAEQLNLSLVHDALHMEHNGIPFVDSIQDTDRMGQFSRLLQSP